MVDTDTGSAPGASDAERWANNFDITHPVLGDTARSQNEYVVTGYPTYVVIDREMVIQEDDLWPFNENYITSLF